MSTRSIVFAVAVLAGSLSSSSASAVEGTTTADALIRVEPRDFRYIDRRHLSDRYLPRDFRYIDRRYLSDKRLPREYRSTIGTPGFRLHKEGFPEIIGD